MKCPTTPMMVEAEVSFIEGVFKEFNPSTFLEVGSGGSTIYFSGFVPKYLSLEHNPKWYKLVSDQLLEQESKVEYFLAPESKGFKDSPYNLYLSAFRQLVREHKPEVILIDGRERVKCARIVEEESPESLILVHDWNREYYHEILDKWDLVREIKSSAKVKSNPHQGIGLLTLKK